MDLIHLVKNHNCHTITNRIIETLHYVFLVIIMSSQTQRSTMTKKHSVSITWLDYSDCFNVNNSFKSYMQQLKLLLFFFVTVQMRIKCVAGVQVSMYSDGNPTVNRRLLEECYRREQAVLIRYSWSRSVYSSKWSSIWVILSSRWLNPIEYHCRIWMRWSALQHMCNWRVLWCYYYKSLRGLWEWLSLSRLKMLCWLSGR